jgi:hypothetical protein
VAANVKSAFVSFSIMIHDVFFSISDVCMFLGWLVGAPFVAKAQVPWKRFGLALSAFTLPTTRL